MFTGTVFIIGKQWKQSSVNTWWRDKENVVYSYNQILLIAYKKLLHAKTLINLKNILTENNPDTKYYMLHNSIYVKFLENAKLWWQKYLSVLPGTRGENNNWLETDIMELLGMIEMFQIWNAMIVVSLYKFTKNYSLYFKWVNFMICDACFNIIVQNTIKK